MPCYEPPGAYGEPTVESLSVLNSAKARMLCEVLSFLNENRPEMIDYLSVETQQWWNEHQMADRKHFSKDSRSLWFDGIAPNGNT